MKYGILFATVAALLVMLAMSQRGWHILLLWPALSFGIVSLGYLHFGPRVYGKSEHGLLAPMAQLLLLPYLLYLWAVWYAVRIVKREAAFNKLTENIYIGRRLFSHELPDGIDHVVDLTCEFNEPKALRSLSYHSFQILDGFVPSSDQLNKWADQISKVSGNIYIHCAEGHGRTGLMAASVLLHLGHSQTPTEALQFIRSKRPLVRLGRCQLAALNDIHNLAGQSGERERLVAPVLKSEAFGGRPVTAVVPRSNHSGVESVMPVFHRDASKRLTYNIYNVESDHYPQLCRELATAFDLKPASEPVVGLDEMFRDYSDGKHTVGLEWEIWSGFIVVAKDLESEQLVRQIAGYLSTKIADQ